MSSVKKSGSSWAPGLRRLVTDGSRRSQRVADQDTTHESEDTGITWRAMRGDGPFDIKDGAGHTDIETTQRYVNEARTFSHGFGEVFPPLPIGCESSPGTFPVAISPVNTASLRG